MKYEFIGRNSKGEYLVKSFYAHGQGCWRFSASRQQWSHSITLKSSLKNRMFWSNIHGYDVPDEVKQLVECAAKGDTITIEPSMTK